MLIINFMMAADEKKPIVIPQMPAMAATLLNTREKVTSMARKILLYLYFHNQKVYDLEQILAFFGGEIKKCLEILFILEGAGMIFRTSRTKFIFQGLEGMILKFQGSHDSSRLHRVQKTVERHGKASRG